MPQNIYTKTKITADVGLPINAAASQLALTQIMERPRNIMRLGQLADVIAVLDGPESLALAPESTTYLQLKSGTGEFVRWHRTWAYDWEQDPIITCRWKAEESGVMGIAQIGTEPWPVSNVDSAPPGMLRLFVANTSVHDGWQTFEIDMTQVAVPQPGGPQALNTYWVRVLLLGEDSQFRAASPSRMFQWGHLDLAVGPSNGDLQPTPIMLPASYPTVTLRHYDPIRYYHTGDENCFLSTVDVTAFNKVVFQKGQVYCGPWTHDSSALDDVVNAIDDAVSWLVAAYDSVAAKFNECLAEAINGIAEVTGLDASDVTAKLREVLAKFGLPLGLPSTAQAIQMGEEYLAGYIAVQMGTPMLQPIIKDGIEAFRKALVEAYEGGGASGKPPVLIPDPKHQEHPAMMVLQVNNDSDDDSHSTNLTVNFSPAIFLPMTFPLRPLLAHESTTISTFLRPNLLAGMFYLHGMIDDMEIAQYWRDQYHKSIQVSLGGNVKSQVPANMIMADAINPVLS